MTQSIEEARELWEKLETDDVGQKRYLMYRIFDLMVEHVYSRKDEPVPDQELRVKKLKDSEGYIYKLSQDFLTSSSTFDKKKKLGKMLDYLD